MARATHWFVYVITNTENGKRYIGKSSDPKKRWLWHMWAARNVARLPLHRAIAKRGPGPFRLEAVAGFACEADAFAFERETIARLGTTDPAVGYNMTSGGEGVSGRPMPRAAREKFAAWIRSDAAAEARCWAWSASVVARTGRPLSAEHRAKVSAAMRGRQFTPEWRQKIADAKRGKDTLSPAQRNRLTERVRGRRHTPEAVAKIVAGLTGRPVSDETRRKIQRGQRIKVSDDDVVRIRAACARGESYARLAEAYGVTLTLISRIAKGQSRKLAGGPITTERRTNANRR